MVSGTQIANARKRKGLTQEALAEQVGVSRQTVAKWEAEKAVPGLANAHKLAEILDLAPEDENFPIAPPEAAEPPALPRAVWVGIWLVYTALLLVCARFFGVGADAALVLISFLAVGVLSVLPSVRAKAGRSCTAIFLRGASFIASGAIAVIVLVAAAIILKGNYRAETYCAIPHEQLENYPAVTAWLQDCDAMGPGIYGQKVELPADKTACLYLVYRNQKTDAADPKLRAKPLRKRFIAAYGSGDEYTGVDLYCLRADTDFQLFFSVGGGEPYFNGLAELSSSFPEEAIQLYGSVKGVQ